MNVVRAHPREWSIVGASLALCLLAFAVAPAFLAPANLWQIALQTAPKLIVIVGMAAVILTREIDISVAATCALAGTVVALASAAGVPFPLAALAAIAVGAAVGALNALLVVRLRVPSIIATLAVWVALDHALRWWREGAPVLPPPAFHWAGLGQDVGGALLVAVALAVLIAAWHVLRQRAVGRWLYAVGGDPAAATTLGIRPGRVVAGAFIACGALTGLAAVGMAFQYRTYTGQGAHLELEVIAAVVVGGVAITGGRGSVLGAAAGLLLLALIGPLLTHLHVAATWQRAVQGAIILAAVATDALRARSRP